MILHVTVCTKDGVQILDNPQAQNAMVEGWQQADHWRVGEYTIMPNHVHFFCAPGVWEYPPVRRWAGYWKRLVGTIEPSLKSVFQEDCWDTQIRDRMHYDEKLAYIRRNPERKGLVERWESWPYRGHVFDIHWL